MYDNIGDKIKRLAKACFITEAIAAVIGAIIMIASAEDMWMAVIGIATLFAGPLIAWVSSWLLYGYGEIIDKLSGIESNTKFSGNGQAYMDSTEELPDL